MKVEFVGPCPAGKSFRVHAAGCADAKREARMHRTEEPWSADVDSRRDAAGEVYGPKGGSFYQEHQGTLESYLDEVAESRFHFAPCCASKLK